MATKDITKKLTRDVPKKPYKVVTSKIQVSFVKDTNKTLTIALTAEINDSSMEDVNDFLFNECLEEANRLLRKVS